MLIGINKNFEKEYKNIFTGGFTFGETVFLGLGVAAMTGVIIIFWRVFGIPITTAIYLGIPFAIPFAFFGFYKPGNMSVAQYFKERNFCRNTEILSYEADYLPDEYQQPSFDMKRKDDFNMRKDRGSYIINITVTIAAIIAAIALIAIGAMLYLNYRAMMEFNEKMPAHEIIEVETGSLPAKAIDVSKVKFLYVSDSNSLVVEHENKQLTVPIVGIGDKKIEDAQVWLKTFLADKETLYLTGDIQTQPYTGYIWLVSPDPDLIKDEAYMCENMLNAHLISEEIFDADFENEHEYKYEFITISERSKFEGYEETPPAEETTEEVTKEKEKETKATEKKEKETKAPETSPAEETQPAQTQPAAEAPAETPAPVQPAPQG